MITCESKSESETFLIGDPLAVKDHEGEEENLLIKIMK
jgi:hypothetical protein